MPKNAGAGHNSGALTEEDASAIQLAFTAKIRAAEAHAAIKADEAASARKAVNGLFSQVRGLLQYTRIEFEEVLAKAAMDDDEFIASEAARAQRFARQGLPIGTQLDMFPATRNDAADDQARAHANGLRAGKRGDEREMPDTISPVFLNDWLRGYDEGQAELGAAFVRANEIAAAKDAKKPELREEPEEDDDGEELTEAAVKAGVRKLKEDGWDKPTDAEQTFTEAAA